jgi:hypothetical protein
VPGASATTDYPLRANSRLRQIFAHFYVCVLDAGLNRHVSPIAPVLPEAQTYQYRWPPRAASQAGYIPAPPILSMYRTNRRRLA